MIALGSAPLRNLLGRHHRMAKRQSVRKVKTAKAANGATVGYESVLWAMADALRGSMDAAEHKLVVLGLIVLKDISDAFEEHHVDLLRDTLLHKLISGDLRAKDAERFAAHIA